ncbi:MAG: hypothetical protein ABW149_07020 [Sedimenticola sp.]
MDQFDQLGEQLDPEAMEGQGESDPEGTGSGSAETTLLMEQWLEQIEGDPAYLLQNQFRRQEQQLMRQRGGPLREPRPW